MPGMNGNTARVVTIVGVIGTLAGVIYGGSKMLEKRLEPVQDHIDHQLEPVKIQVDYNVGRLDEQEDQIDIVKSALPMAARNRDALEELESEKNELTEQMAEVSTKVDGLLRGQERILDWIDSQ